MHFLRVFMRGALRRRWVFAALASSLISAGCASGPPTSFVAAWTASQQDALEPGLPHTMAIRSMEAQTLRQVLRVSTAGEGMRIKLSNRFGKAPVVFDAVHVARSTAASSVDIATQRSVTLNGQTRFALPAGAEVWSDLVPLAVPAHALVAVSLSTSGPTPFVTQHIQARQTAFLAPGALSSAATLAYPEFLPSYYWLAGVDVVSHAAPKVVVAFGDSITDGFGSTPDQSRRYPDLLDNRLKAAGRHAAVVNAGLSGNRWLNDMVGPSGESRFVRDVLEVSGVTHVVILMGINDIGYAVDRPWQDVSAEQLIAAMSTASMKARTRGVAVIFGTLPPFGNARYFTEAGETKRQAINAWIRNNANLHGIADFDRALRDPSDPTTLLPAFDSGDHLHPNDDGYAAMAGAVDLDLLP